MKIIKSMLLVVLALMGLQNSAWSQKDKSKCTKMKDSSPEIIWDFSTGKLTEPCCIKKGQNLPIIITNVNRTLFDITIGKEFKKFDATLPDILNFEQVKQVLQAETASSMVDQTVSASAFTNATTDSLQKEEQAKNSLIAVLISSQKIIDCGICLEEALKNSSTYEVAQERKKMCLQGKSINAVRSKLDSSYQAILQNESFVRTNSKDLTTVKHLNEAVDAADLQKAIEDIVTLYYTLSDPKTFEFSTTLPIEEAYELVLNLDVSPKKGVNKDGDSRPLHLPIKGLKLSISPGFFVNYFPGAELYYPADHPTSPDSVFIRTAFDPQTLTPSTGALIHVSFLGCKNLDWAISTGASFLVESTQMRWHLGGSMLLGKQRRLVISLGASLGTGIPSLHPSYSKDRAYSKANLEGKTLLQKTPQLGAFLGITYNLPIKTNS